MRSEHRPESGIGLRGWKGTRNLRHERSSRATAGLTVYAAEEGGAKTARRSSAVALGSEEEEWEAESLKEEAAAREKEMRMVKRRGAYEFTIVASPSMRRVCYGSRWSTQAFVTLRISVGLLWADDRPMFTR